MRLNNFVQALFFFLLFGYFSRPAAQDRDGAWIADYAKSAQAEPTHYHNPEYGYSLDVPKPYRGFGTPPPAPNHGLGIPLGYERVIVVDGSYDAAEFGSAEKYLQRELKDRHTTRAASERIGGLEAERVEYELKAVNGAGPAKAVLIVARRDRPGDIGILYTLQLRTTSDSFEHDRQVLNKVAQSFKLHDLPR